MTCLRPDPGASELLCNYRGTEKITEMFYSGKLVTDVGTVLRLEEARHAHEMLEGAPHKRGKIVLSVAV